MCEQPATSSTKEPESTASSSDAQPTTAAARLRAGLRFFAGAVPIFLVDGAKLLVPGLTVMHIGYSASSAIPLAAASLGVLTFNVCGNMIITAPLSAMDTIAPQMFGAGNVVGVGLTAQRALLTALAFLVPTIPLWIWASEILVALGQPPEVAALARRYMLLLLPALAPFSIFEVARKYVYAQGVLWPPLPAACGGLASHALWLHLTTKLLGPLGAPLAPCLTYATMALALLAIIRWRVPHAVAAWPRSAAQRAQLWRDRRAWRYFLTTSVSALLALTEWLFWEFVCMRVGQLGVVPLAAYTVGYSLEPVFVMIAFGTSTAISNAVGNHLGAARVAEAKHATATGLVVGSAVVGAYVAAAFISGDLLVGLFSREPAVLTAAAATWSAWCVFLLTSGAFMLLLGLLKGLGMQRQLAVLVVCGLWPVGAPLVWLATSPTQVWQHLTLTYALLTAAMALLAGCSDWHRLSERAVRLSASASTAEEQHGVGLANVGLAAADGHAAAARDAREAAE